MEFLFCCENVKSSHKKRGEKKTQQCDSCVLSYIFTASDSSASFLREIYIMGGDVCVHYSVEVYDSPEVMEEV